MSARTASNEASPAAAFEHGAERLLGTITATCDPRAGFSTQVEAALRAALALFVSDPALARRLTIEPFLGEEADLACQQRWSKRYGALLRHAAAERPETLTHPPFFEPTLIGGITFQISRRVLAGKVAELKALLPELLEFVLAYYLVPQDASRIAGAPGPPIGGV